MKNRCTLSISIHCKEDYNQNQVEYEEVGAMRWNFNLSIDREINKEIRATGKPLNAVKESLSTSKMVKDRLLWKFHREAKITS